MVKSFSILLIVIGFLSNAIHAQGDIAQSYIVMAENGLNIRKEPTTESKRIGKLYCGAKIRILEKTSKTLSVNDKGKIIKGEWVKIE